MVDKLRSYDTESNFGLWKNTAIIVADDEYKAGMSNPSSWSCCEYFHMTQAESLSAFILPSPIDRKKIYLVEAGGTKDEVAKQEAPIDWAVKNLGPK